MLLCSRHRPAQRHPALDGRQPAVSHAFLDVDLAIPSEAPTSSKGDNIFTNTHAPEQPISTTLNLCSLRMDNTKTAPKNQK